MYRLCPHPVQQGYVVRGSQADVQSLREVHIGAALRKLQNQPFMVRAGQQIGVQQLDLPLSVPKLGQVGHLMAPPPLFAGNDAKSAGSRTATGQKTVGCIGKLRI